MLAKLKAKREEFYDNPPHSYDDKYEELENDGKRFRAYEEDLRSHKYCIECLDLTILKIETAAKVRHAMDLIGEKV